MFRKTSKLQNYTNQLKKDFTKVFPIYFSRSFWRHFSNRSYPKVKITLAYLNIIRIV